MAMGIELRRRGVPVKWWSFSFNLTTRLETASTVIKAYKSFKREQTESPIFFWAMALFGAGIIVVPIIALIVFLAGG